MKKPKPQEKEEATQSMANEFIRALRQCELNGDVAPMVDLFSERALICNPVLPHPFHGTEGAHSFWTEYRQAFREVHSHFTRVNGGGPIVSLEWTSEGITRNGRPVTYRGVSLLEFEANPMSELRITRFQAYYDTAAMIDHEPGSLEHRRDVSEAA